MNRILLSLLIISIAFIGISTVAAVDVNHSGMDRVSYNHPVCSGHIDYEHHIYVFDDDDGPINIDPRPPAPYHPVGPYNPTDPFNSPVQ